MTLHLNFLLWGVIFWAIISALAWLVWLSLGYKLNHQNIKIRGILRTIASEELSTNNQKLIKFWLVALIPVAVFPWVAVILGTWQTDHSFWIGLFPILYYHYLGKYLFWTKKSLKELKAG